MDDELPLTAIKHNMHFFRLTIETKRVEILNHFISEPLSLIAALIETVSR